MTAARFPPDPVAPDPFPADLDPVERLGPWTHRTVRANGIALHVVEAGTGPLVLLLHGFPGCWWSWRTALVDLADAGLHAVAIDLRGVGASDKPPRGYDAPTLSDDVAAVVTALGERSCVVVGHDVGGLLAWTMAARHPRVVRRVVAVGAAHPLRLREAITHGGRDDDLGLTQRQASGYALTGFQVPRRPERRLHDPEFVRGLFDRWAGPGWTEAPGYADDVAAHAAALRRPGAAHCSLEVFRWLVRSLPRPDGRRFAAQVAEPVTAPVLHLHGALDRCVLPSTAAGSGRYVRGEYAWRLLPGVGHFPAEETPELISGEIIRWAKDQ